VITREEDFRPRGSLVCKLVFAALDRCARVPIEKLNGLVDVMIQ
jgi:hypothetical protein